MSFSAHEFAGKKKVTRRERFLAEMDAVVPWTRLVALIEPHYYKGKRGRPPLGIERMLRVYFLSQWFGLADEAVEDTIYDSCAMRAFVGVDLCGGPGVPDATTLLKFRHLLERHNLTKAIFEEINNHMVSCGMRMSSGTIVDATIISAPSSTKNKEKARDPEMHSVKKGNQYYFGMKAHVGVCATTGHVHSVEATPANESERAVAQRLLRGNETTVHGDAGYLGIEKRPEHEGRGCEFYIAEKRSRIKAMPEGFAKKVYTEWERRKAQMRAIVEHPFHMIKNIFRHRKTRYRGIRKNHAQLYILFGLANLYRHRRRLAMAMTS